MVIAHNLSAISAQRNYNIVNNLQKKTAEKLASGYRINRASDDAAGLAISEKMRKQIRGLNQGAANIQDGISLCQVADGALSEVHDMLHRMNELAVKSANGTLSLSDRKYIQDEINQITKEIDRVGSTTKFNSQLIFDSSSEKVSGGKITQLVSCLSAEKGYLGECYKVSGKYMAAAYIDFSNVNGENISMLHGGNFGFYCSQSCNEIFDITFVTDGTPSSAKNLGDSAHTQEHHLYTIDISNCRDGCDIVDTVLNYVGSNLPYQRNGASPSYGDLKVSHSNNLAKANRSSLVIYSSQTTGYSTPEAAANAYPVNGNYSSNSGKVFCSNFTKTVTHEPVFDFRIQCSGESDDAEHVQTYRMNSYVLGVRFIDVKTEKSATNSIDLISNAISIISSERAGIGAIQNRLMHAYASNLNTSENTQAAESQIRDADMATEMLRYSNTNILIQAGQSILAQANHSQSDILALLSN